MNYHFETKPGFLVAGHSRRVRHGDNLSLVWFALHDRINREKLQSLGSGQSYGAVWDMTEDGEFTYFVGYETEDRKKPESLGLDILDVPETHYLVLELTGPVPSNIYSGWEYILGTLKEKENLIFTGSKTAPDLEVYGDDNLFDEDYQMHLWVPVKNH